MRAQLGNLEIRVHALLPLALLVMMQLGAGDICLWAFFCLLLHELGHLLAARLLGLRALSLDVMPMGGVLHIGGLYRLPARQMVPVALAGPLVSLVLAVLCTQISSRTGMQLAVINMVIGLFNLLPGLPLDGGRLLAALLKPLLGVRRAVDVAVWMGRCIGVALLAIAACHWLAHGKLLFPLLLMGVFQLASAGREREDCLLSPAEDVLRMIQVNRLAQPLPVQAIACPPRIRTEELLRLLRPDRLNMLAQLDEQGGVERWRTDREWLQELIEGEAPERAHVPLK